MARHKNTPRENHLIWVMQCNLRARKTCEMCETYLEVSEFAGYGAQPCEECRLEQQRARGMWGWGKPRGAIYWKGQPLSNG